MGNQRAIIFLGTAIASLALVLGMIAVLPTTTDLQATSSDINLSGHFAFTVADPDGTIVHYAQMDNFATDAFKTGIINTVSGEAGGLGSALFIALCDGDDAADAYGLDNCTSEFSASGRCTAASAGVAADPGSTAGTSNAATNTLSCDTTINVAEGNRKITNLSINSGGTSDDADALAISRVTTEVTVFGNQIVSSAFTINANNA